jgi:hydroxypyruvate isomerase
MGDFMTPSNEMSRRAALATLTSGVSGTLVAGLGSAGFAAEKGQPAGRLKQSASRWCYGRIPLEKLVQKAKEIGLVALDLLSHREVKISQPLGLTCSLLTCPTGIADGLNRKENHERIEKTLRADIDFASENGLTNVLCMSGNRRGLSDEEGLENCALGLKRILPYAEAKKITVIIEGLNSKVDHKDYMYDKTAWGVALCKKVGSPNFKLLYDIYHKQIMEGDVIRTIRDNIQYIGHFHTGGVPGRHEIDDTQELNYRAIARAIADSGFSGFVAHEFVPVREPLKSLAQAFEICNV